MGNAWDDYLRPPGADRVFSQCHVRCREDFARNRAHVQRIFDATKPKTVACLGAGLLNDIPYRHMVEAGTSLHLVDWVPGTIDAGIALSIIQQRDDGKADCLYCHPSVACPQQYCRHYQESSERGDGVCDNFSATPEAPLRCAAFEKGERPAIHYEDVTGGYAGEFGRRIDDELHGVRTWKQAFARATALACHVSRHASSLTIPDASVQLVTSSMVMSQFDHEPYNYFTHRTAARLGSPKTAEEVRLRPTMESLRETLLANQIERHCEEIRRILTPDGRCYLSFEMFHRIPDATDWFAVKGMPAALETVGRYFVFDFDLISHENTVTRFESGSEPSLVLSFALSPRN